MEMEDDEIFKLTSKDGNISVEKETVMGTGRRPSEAASRNRKMKGEPRTGEMWPCQEVVNVRGAGCN